MAPWRMALREPVLKSGAQEAANVRSHLFQAGGAAEFFEVEAEVGERCDDGEDD